MTKFIKTKFKKSDDQTNIDKCRVAANITEYYIISKLIFLKRIIPKIIKKKAIISCKILTFGLCYNYRIVLFFKRYLSAKEIC